MRCCCFLLPFVIHFAIGNDPEKVPEGDDPEDYYDIMMKGPDYHHVPVYNQRLPDDWTSHQDLHGKLLQGYNRNLRPVRNLSHVTYIDFYMTINHLEYLDPVRQTIKFHGWLTMGWKDEFITWENDNAFSSIPRLLLPQYYVWKPDVHLYNNAKMREHVLISWNTWLHAFSNGSIIFDPPFTMEPTCNFDFHEYPYDTQHCSLYLGSYSYFSNQLRWRITPGYTLEYMTSVKHVGAEWTISGAAESIFHYRSSYGTWEGVSIDITLKRNAGLIPTAIYLPVLCLSTIVVMSFLLNSNKPRVLALIMAILCGIAHLYFVIRLIPNAIHNRTPFCVTFSSMNLLLSLFAFVIAVLSNLLLSRDKKTQGPYWLMQIIDRVPLTAICCLPKSRLKSNSFDHHQLVSYKDYDISNSVQSIDTGNSVASVDRPVIISNDWLLISCFIDRLCFIVFSCIYAILWFAYVL